MLTARHLRVISFSTIVIFFVILIYNQRYYYAQPQRQRDIDYSNQDQHILSKERKCHPTPQFGGYVLNSKGTAKEILKLVYAYFSRTVRSVYYL